MTNPTAHWSPSERDDPDGDRASYPPPAPGVIDLDAEAERLRASLAATEADLCARCGALDLGHTCHAAAGERFAAEHPYAAGAMHGGIAHRSEVKK